MWGKSFWSNTFWGKSFWSKGGGPSTAPDCNTGFIGKIEASDIGFQGLLDPIDLGFEGIVTDSIGFNGNIGPIITVTKTFNPNQGSMIYGILTLSVTGEPIGIGFQGKIHTDDQGFIGAIDDSDIGFNGTVCGC